MSKAVLVRNELGNARLYVDGTCCGSWDKHDSDRHIWSQVARKTSEEEVEERTVEGPLPDKLPKAKAKAAPKKKPKLEAEKPTEKPEEPAGPMTSYSTGKGVIEAL